MTYLQRDIVEVVYVFPGEKPKPHMVIIISNSALHETENIFYGVLLSSKVNPKDFALVLTNDMLNGKGFSKPTYVKTHMIQSYYFDEIIQKFGSVKKEAFTKIKNAIQHNIFEAE